MRDQLNETSKLNTINFSNQDEHDHLRVENNKYKEELKILESRYTVLNREVNRLKKENSE